MDATACPQNIAYPTDLNLLNDAREKSEELIDELQAGLTTAKPRTYREIARKKYLQTAQKKKKTKKSSAALLQYTWTHIMSGKKRRRFSRHRFGRERQPPRIQSNGTTRGKEEVSDKKEFAEASA